MEAVRMSFLLCWPSLLLLAAIRVESRLRRNVALHRPARQSSTYGHGEFIADVAVDGLIDGRPSCTHSYNYSWWSIDLGSFCSVVGVNLTTDNHSYTPWRLENFVVGLTNDSPDVVPPVFKSNYYVCAQYPGQPPIGTTFYMACPPNAPLARYVIIQGSSQNGATCLVEVEVYVASFEWKKADGKRLVNNKVRDVAAASMMGCMTSCITDRLCDSFNLRVADNACELNTHPDSGVPNGDLVTDDAWSWWAPAYTNLV